MPLGFERLNERTTRPNANINFIKPLSSTSPADQKIAKDFLERIAAQCYPIMKETYTSVMALEEYPPNPEFLGRNFNAGEVIQLVLKDKSGRWLSFQFVQMVMMHELAHCKQMNHSKFFWQVRNQYADQMKGLWSKGYKGEGLWGRGVDLTTGAFVHDKMPNNADIPEHLCGGTYRRARGKKRKRGGDQNGDSQPKVSYAERQQKRIAKRFGVHGDGQDLGEDELVRGALEQGRRSYAKPKVAKSKRGRELRANAALARFEALKNVRQQEKKPELGHDDDSETDSGEDDDEYANGMPTLEKLGSMIKDQDGHDMFRVCGDEGDKAEGGQDEFDELQLMTGGSATSNKTEKPAKRLYEDSETEVESDDEVSLTAPQQDPPPIGKDPGHIAATRAAAPETIEPPHPVTCTSGAQLTTTDSPEPSFAQTLQTPPSTASCPICSLESDPASPTCIACAHVLKPSLVPKSWRCNSDACKGSKYLNAGDVARCGLCGRQKPLMTSGNGRPMGLTGAEVLRWD